MKHEQLLMSCSSQEVQLFMNQSCICFVGAYNTTKKTARQRERVFMQYKTAVLGPPSVISSFCAAK